MLEPLRQGDLGCNRRVGGLCSCVSYQLVHLEFRYVKLNLARFHHISSACNSTSVEAIHYHSCQVPKRENQERPRPLPQLITPTHEYH